MFISRRRRLPVGPYDSSAQAFFNYAAGFGTLSAAEMSAADTLIRALKSNRAGSYSYWDEAGRIYLMIGSNLATARLCCKSLTQATLVNTPALYSRNIGIDWGGVSCFKTGFVPSVNGGPSGFGPGWIEDVGALGFTVYDAQGLSGAWTQMALLTCTVMGATNTVNSKESSIVLDASVYYGSINVPFASAAGPSFTGAAYQTARFQTSSTHSYEDDMEFIEDFTDPSLAASDLEIYVGARNLDGAPTEFMNGQPMTTAWMGGMMANCELYFNAFNAALGRIYP
jgi:hypothetical protein